VKVKEIRLRNFRNIAETVLTPDEHLNFIIGDNGQGKTSILEGLGFLSTLRSFRGAKKDEVVRFGENWSEIGCTVTESEDWQHELKVTFVRIDGPSSRMAKTAFIDGKPVKSSTQYLSSRFGQVEVGFHSIVFNPSDHDLIRGEPAIRRAYLDRTLSAEDPSYLKCLSRYQKTLEQRNALLKNDVRPRPEVLDGFSENLITLGAQIARARLEWIYRLREKLDFTLQKIVPAGLPLRAFYTSSWIKKNDGISITSADFDPLLFPLQTPLPSLEFFEANLGG